MGQLPAGYVLYPVLFISRSLGPESVLRRWAGQRQWVLQDRSLIRFAALPFTPPTGTDWWFYYSSRAVHFAGLPPPGVRIAALGSSTAAAALTRCGRVDFSGGGQPQRVAEDFLAVAAGQRVFFPRARQSRRTVQSALVNRLTALDAVCYDNRPAPPPAPIEAAVYIFTSPLNVAAYLDHHALSPGARVLAFGPSTAAALRGRGVSCTYPNQPSEAALLPLLDELYPPRLPP